MCSESKSPVSPLIDFTPSAIFFQTWHNLCLAQPHLTHSETEYLYDLNSVFVLPIFLIFCKYTHITSYVQGNWNLKFFFRTLPWGCVFGIFYIWQPSRGGEGGEWGNLNRAMHKLQKAKMKSGNAEIFDRNPGKNLEPRLKLSETALQRAHCHPLIEIIINGDTIITITINHHHHPHQHDNLFTW